MREAASQGWATRALESNSVPLIMSDFSPAAGPTTNALPSASVSRTVLVVASSVLPCATSRVRAREEGAELFGCWLTEKHGNASPIAHAQSGCDGPL